MINNRFNVVYHLLCVVILWVGINFSIFIYKRNIMSKEMRKIIDTFRKNVTKPDNIWVSDFKKENPKNSIVLFNIDLLNNKLKKWNETHYDVNPYDKSKVDRLVLKNGEDLPPVIIEKDKNNEFHIIDGWHRLSAAQKRGDTKIKALVKNYYT